MLDLSNKEESINKMTIFKHGKIFTLVDWEVVAEGE